MTTTPADHWTVYVYSPAFNLRADRLTCTTGHLATRLLGHLDAAGLITSGWIEPETSRPGIEPEGVGRLMQAALLAGIPWPADLWHDEPDGLNWKNDPGRLWCFPFVDSDEPTPAEAFADAVGALRRAIVSTVRRDLERLRHWARTEWKMLRDLHR